MLLLGLDFETTGLDFAKDRIIEVGAVLWDTTRGVPVRMLSELVSHPDSDECPEVSEEITRITGITQADLDQFSVPWMEARRALNGMALAADAVVAHNGTGFDQPMLCAHLDRLEHSQAPHLEIWRGPWIDTCTDVDYPPAITTRKLTHLAAEHGFLNPFPHRAVSDVLTMLKVLSHYDIGPVLESSRQPSFTVRAMVSYDDREKAKARGYRWDGGKKVWTKIVKGHRLNDEIEACNPEFEVSIC